MSRRRVISVVSNKGGVGKTTLACNLAVYLRALREDLPILVLGLDDQDLLERMFALAPRRAAEPTVREALAARDLAPAIRLGEYGVHYVPPSPTLEGRESLAHRFVLRELLEASGWDGFVVIDTKGDLGVLTQNALAASDLALIVVSDRASLDQAERIYGLLDDWGRPRESGRIVLSLVDRRVKYRDGEDADVLALLLSEIRRRGYPCFESFLSRSPKIEALATNREWRAHSILTAARGSLIHQQLAHLARDVLHVVEAMPAAETGDERRREPRRPFRREIPCFAPGEAPILALRTRNLSAGGIAVEPHARLASAGRVELLLDAEGAGEPLLVWARLVRSDGECMALRFEAPAAARLSHFVAGLEPAATEPPPR